ncbi:MAG: hypothetical protein M3Z10_13360 [Gemmatimonadota bacterium]|nr:hypothetical protein [Gemmatimonadota bacterium]
MTGETRARFLAAIGAQIPADRVQELHLFGAIRQGGTESGIAVIAVARDADEVVDADAIAEPESVVDEAPIAPPRYVVYTARYRLTLKGLERGKWEMSVKEEADAPLLTVDAVVRGVSRRSGDADETVRLTGDEFRAALPEPARS